MTNFETLAAATMRLDEAERMVRIGKIRLRCEPTGGHMRHWVAANRRLQAAYDELEAARAAYEAAQDLPALEQAIAQVGVDRAALIRTIRDGSFDTLFGPLRLENNQRVAQPWVGQWQGENFAAVGGAGPLQPVQFPKPAWRTA